MVPTSGVLSLLASGIDAPGEPLSLSEVRKGCLMQMKKPWDLFPKTELC
jgi:hypothetical protein